MIREFLVWLQRDLGKGAGDSAQSWSEALLGSLNFWSLLEGTHLLSLMLFAGTIFIVDLRLLGITFQRTPVSVVCDRILPLTVAGFLLVVLTGLALFYAKPLFYYHNVWFRVKLIFLAAAMLNVFFFHSRVRRNGEAWDIDTKPPRKVRAAAAASLASWLVVIVMGRFLAYDWFECGKPIPYWANVAQDCRASEGGAIDLVAINSLPGHQP